MNKLLSIVFVFMCCIFISPNSARAADATAGLDWATSYIFRGTTLNNRWVAQPYMEISGFPAAEGLSIGTWANFDAANGSQIESNGSFSEIDLYASYDLPLELDPFSLAIGYTEYTYPNSELDADRELAFSFAFDTVLNPTYDLYVGLDGGIEEQVFMELSAGEDVDVSEEVSASFGTSVAALFPGSDSDADSGFSYVMFSTGLSYDIISLTGNFFVETDDKVTDITTVAQGILGVSVDF